MPQHIVRDYYSPLLLSAAQYFGPPCFNYYLGAASIVLLTEARDMPVPLSSPLS